MADIVRIFGTSGFAKEVADIVAIQGSRPVLVASDEAARTRYRGDLDVILERDVLANSKGVGFAIGVGDNVVRQKIANRYQEELNFVNLIHPHASFGRGQRERIENCKGNIVCAGSRFTNSIEMGNFGIFNLNCTIGHDCILKDFVNIAPGANISGYVKIGEGSWIGTGAAINEGRAEPEQWLTIGPRTVVGSGAVVTRDCDGDSVYVGAPAKKRA